jgi:hypothetical protein
MLIGLDFDNTIVCYDGVIATLSKKILDTPSEVPRTKLGLRDYLRSEGREPEWTAFQGELYGPGMRDAEPFEGAINVMARLASIGHQLVIVSHRSLRPYSGPPYDLHAAARAWVSANLQRAGLFGNGEVYFLETLESKLATISKLGCKVFLDDLPAVLEAPNFPANTIGILFDPAAEHVAESHRHRISRWIDLPNVLEQLV